MIRTAFVGLLALAACGRRGSDDEDAAPPAVVSVGTAVASFISEIDRIRMLALVLGSATHSFELRLSAFIAGLAFGAWSRTRWTRPAKSPRAPAAWPTSARLGRRGSRG